MYSPALAVLASALFFVAQPVACEKSEPPVDIQRLAKEFQESFDKTVAEAKKNLNLPENPDGAAIVKAIREQSNKAEKGLADIRKNIQETIEKNPEISGALDNLKKRVDEAKEKLRKENPEVASNLQKVLDTVRSGYESVGKEVDKIQSELNKKGGVRDELDNLLKNIIDRGNAAAKEFGARIQEAIKENKKS